MDELIKQPLDEFLASVADATPAPGGGSSAGVAAALAAALVEMAARLASSGPAAAAPDRAAVASPSHRAADQARALRARALRLAQEELTSYAPVLEARDERERSLALAAASEPPAQIAEVAADIAELGVEVAESASAAVRGDALTGVTLAEAAASAAFRLVEINLGSGPVLSARPCRRATGSEGPGIRDRSPAANRARPDAQLTAGARVSGSCGPSPLCRSRPGP